MALAKNGEEWGGGEGEEEDARGVARRLVGFVGEYMGGRCLFFWGRAGRSLRTVVAAFSAGVGGSAPFSGPVYPGGRAGSILCGPSPTAREVSRRLVGFFVNGYSHLPNGSLGPP